MRIKDIANLILVVVGISLLWPSLVSAEESAKLMPDPATILSSESRAAPNVVIFGLYPTALYDFDAKHNSFKIDFYAWWRTKDKNYQPEKSIEIVNAEKYSSKFGIRAKNGFEYFTNVHYYAKIRHDWDPRNFPFDHQTLTVSLEDFDDLQHVVFEPDYEQSAIHPEFTIPNWKILNFELHKTVTHYNTNFGDTATPKGQYSRLTMQIDIKHDGWVSFFNYFIAFFVTAFLSSLVFFLEKESLEVRMLIILSAVFAFIGNKYVLDTIIADAGSYSLANVIQIATFILMFISILFLISEKNMSKRYERQRILINHIVGYVATVLYVICVSMATYFAVIS